MSLVSIFQKSFVNLTDFKLQNPCHNFSFALKRNKYWHFIARERSFKTRDTLRLDFSSELVEVFVSFQKAVTVVRGPTYIPRKNPQFETWFGRFWPSFWDSQPLCGGISWVIIVFLIYYIILFQSLALLSRAILHIR